MRGAVVGHFSPRRDNILGKPRPYLRHLQHRRFGLRVRRDACDLQASRSKPTIFTCPPHAEDPRRRFLQSQRGARE